MKLLIFTFLMLTMISNNTYSAELQIVSTYNNEEISALNKKKYDSEMIEWLKLPEAFNQNQTIQLVVPNSELESFESILIDAGKVSRQNCEEKILEIQNKLDSNLQQSSAMRCLSSNKPFNPPDETDDLELIRTYESKDSVSFVSWGGTKRRTECNEKLKKDKSPNFFSENKKYDFNNPGCLVFVQNINISGLSKDEPIVSAAPRKCRKNGHLKMCNKKSPTTWPSATRQYISYDSTISFIL